MSSSVTERPSSSYSSSSSATSLSVTEGREKEIDPLFKDLSEKKQSFRRNVVSLAAELKEVRSRLSSQEQSYARETLTRQVNQIFVSALTRGKKKGEKNDCKLFGSAACFLVGT